MFKIIPDRSVWGYWRGLLLGVGGGLAVTDSCGGCWWMVDSDEVEAKVAT